MKRNMKEWLAQLVENPVKKPFPILSFPAISLMGIGVGELIASSEAQATGMELVAKRTNAAASVSLMDLSVEAQCFGAQVRVLEGEVPTVTGARITSEEEAKALPVPPIGAGRTGIYIEAIEKAAQRIEDRPVFAGVIGPFSLAARLLDVTQIMVDCYDEPGLVHILLQKATTFITDYCKAYQQAGANGVMIAEPVAGLLSPALAEEFSAPYVKQIVDAVQNDSFAVIYHNCGGSTLAMIDSILSIGAAAYHFGNAVSMAEVLARVPAETIVMGHIDPAGEFRGGAPETIRKAPLELLGQCGSHANFVISSGCDIPPLARWENIDAFFAAVREFYEG